MQSSTELTSTRRTRMSNATKHPGLPDAPTKRRSHAEKLADDVEQSELQAAQQTKVQLTLEKIASVKEAMEASQDAKCLAMKKGTRPSRPRSVKEGVAAANVPQGQ